MILAVGPAPHCSPGLRRGRRTLLPAAFQLRPSVDSRIVHSIPGRVRLRFGREESATADALASRLRAHPAVRSASRNAHGRSLIVQYDATQEFADLIRTLPPPRQRRDDRVHEAAGIDWGKVAFSCLLTMLPLGCIGSVALTLATAILEQSGSSSVRGPNHDGRS